MCFSTGEWESHMLSRRILRNWHRTIVLGRGSLMLRRSERPT